MQVVVSNTFQQAAPVPRFGALSIAVLIPCYNEAAAIGTVVGDFRKALPEADIYVYDNNSTDGTAEIAAEAGAIVRREPRQGKGHVVRRMFADVEADIFLMVDGDDTWRAVRRPTARVTSWAIACFPASCARSLVEGHLICSRGIACSRAAS